MLDIERHYFVQAEPRREIKDRDGMKTGNRQHRPESTERRRRGQTARRAVFLEQIFQKLQRMKEFKLFSGCFFTSFLCGSGNRRQAVRCA